MAVGIVKSDFSITPQRLGFHLFEKQSDRYRKACGIYEVSLQLPEFAESLK